MNIALLEDDVDFAATVKDWLQDAGHEVDHFSTGLSFLRNFSNKQYDLCVFDWMLPDMEGPDVMVSIKLRSNKLPPIIFFTGRAEEEDIIRVIESGADDYLVKPASRGLLLARVGALLRRANPEKAELEMHDYGNLKVDAKHRIITLDGRDVSLTDKEFDLILYFLKNEGTLLSRAHLMSVVWASLAEVETRKVDVHVSHLRTKLKLVPENGWRLTSIYQQGYRLERVPT